MMISSGLIQIPFHKGEAVVVEGDPGDAMFIIKKGEIGVYKGDKRIRILK